MLDEDCSLTSVAIFSELFTLQIPPPPYRLSLSFFPPPPIASPSEVFTPFPFSLPLFPLPTTPPPHRSGLLESIFRRSSLRALAWARLACLMAASPSNPSSRLDAAGLPHGRRHVPPRPSSFSPFSFRSSLLLSSPSRFAAVWFGRKGSSNNDRLAAARHRPRQAHALQP